MREHRSVHNNVTHSAKLSMLSTNLFHDVATVSKKYIDNYPIKMFFSEKTDMKSALDLLIIARVYSFMVKSIS